MIFWIVLGLTAAALGWFLWQDEPEPFWIGVAVLLVLSIAALIVAPKEQTTNSERRTLLTLRDSVHEHSSFSGAYVLIAGSVSGSSGPEWEYTWYEEESSGAVHLRSEKATDQKISVFQDATHPYVRIVEHGVRRPTPDWMVPFDGFSDDNQGVETELHVPPGTVERDLQLNAK